MGRVAMFKGYGRAVCQHVVLSRILRFEEYSSNCDSGTLIFLDDGEKVLVGEWPSDVAKAIEESEDK